MATEDTFEGDAAKFLVKLVAEYSAQPDRETPKAKGLLNQIRAMGHAAAFFGGYQGMSALCQAAELLERQSGYWIGQLWDGIADWTA